MNVTYHIAGFIFCALVIVFSGVRLAKYGDLMADLLGWGKMFVGLILMASVTSLPELMTGFGSVVLVDAPDLALADVLGSCAFNILIISILDIFHEKSKPITSDTKIGHIIAATFSIIQLAVVALSIMMPNIFGHIGWIGNYSFIIAIIYFVSMRVVYLYDKKSHELPIVSHPGTLTIRQVVARYILNALIVMAAASFLPYFGEHLAEASGLGQSFFGTLFISASTSLPEIVVSIAAVRMGMIDMAVGNLFGSNLFNMMIFVVDDAMYHKGPILDHTLPINIIPAVFTIIITCIGIAGIVYKSAFKWKLAIDTGMILLFYVAMMILLYMNR